MITRWLLIDLNAWRANLIRYGQRYLRDISAMGMKDNGDGTHFVWFDIEKFPKNPPIIIAASHPIAVSEAA